MRIFANKTQNKMAKNKLRTLTKEHRDKISIARKQLYANGRVS